MGPYLVFFIQVLLLLFLGKWQQPCLKGKKIATNSLASPHVLNILTCFRGHGEIKEHLLYCLAVFFLCKKIIRKIIWWIDMHVGEAKEKAMLVRFNPKTDLHMPAAVNWSQIEPRQYHFLN